jgi:hypothetical protein
MVHTRVGYHCLRRTDDPRNNRPQRWRLGTAIRAAGCRRPSNSAHRRTQLSGSPAGIHSRHLVTELPQATGAVANPFTAISRSRGRGHSYRRPACREGGRLFPHPWPRLADPRRSRSLGDQALRGLSSAWAHGVQHRSAGHVYHRPRATHPFHVYQQGSV